MSKKADEVAELRAEVETLKAEVAFLRTQQAAHVCPSWPQSGGGNVWPGPIRWTNVCGGAAGMPQTQFVDTTCATTLTVTPAIGAAAGCAPPQTFFMANAGL